jgi:DNA-directed RNA polymerase specialized sigma24 family protein
MLARASDFRGRVNKSSLEHMEDIVALRRAIVRLPRLERRAVLLRHWFRVSSAVGGERLGIAPQRFTRAVCNGLRILRGMLGDDFLEEVA